MYNKNKFRKINDKKILRKIKKHWVTISLSIFGLISGSALINANAHASVNENANNQTKNNSQLTQPVKNLRNPPAHIINSNPDYNNVGIQSNSVNENNNRLRSLRNNIINQGIKRITSTGNSNVSNIQNQAKVLHSGLLNNKATRLYQHVTALNQSTPVTNHKLLINYVFNNKVLSSQTVENNGNIASQLQLPKGYSRVDNEPIKVPSEDNVTQSSTPSYGSDESGYPLFHAFISSDGKTLTVFGDFQQYTDSDANGLDDSDNQGSDDDTSFSDVTTLNLGNAINLTTTKNLFANLPQLQRVNEVGDFDTRSVTDWNDMFANDPKLQNVSNVETRLENKGGSNDQTSINPQVIKNSSGSIPIEVPVTNASSVWTGLKWGNANVTIDDRSDTIHVFGGGQVGKTKMPHSNAIQDQSIMDNIYSPESQANIPNTYGYPLESLPNKNQDWKIIVSDAIAPSDSSQLFYDNYTSLANQIASISVKGLHGRITNSSQMFSHNPRLVDVSDLGTLNLVSDDNFSRMFSDDPLLTNQTNGVDATDLDLSDLQSPIYARNVNASNMFRNDPAFTGIRLSDWDTSHVINMSGMFSNDSGLQFLGLGYGAHKFSTQNNQNDDEMFQNDTSLNDLELGEHVKFDNKAGLPNKWYLIGSRNGTPVNLLDGRVHDGIWTSNRANVVPYTATINYYDFVTGKYIGQSKADISDEPLWYSKMHLPEGYRIADQGIDNGPNGTHDYLPDLATHNQDQIFQIPVVGDQIQEYGYLGTARYQIDNNGNAYVKDGTVNADDNYRKLSYNPRIKSIVFSDVNVSTPSLAGMFQRDPNVKSIKLGDHFVPSMVTDMHQMFKGDFNLNTLNLGQYFDTSNVTNMAQMFQSDAALGVINLPSRFSTNNVTDMNNMFANDTSLTNLDLSNFNTQRVSNMSSMFSGDTSLTTLDLGKHFSTEATGNESKNLWGFFHDDTALNKVYLSATTNLNADNGSYGSPFKDCCVDSDGRLLGHNQHNGWYYAAKRGAAINYNQDGHLILNTEGKNPFARIFGYVYYPVKPDHDYKGLTGSVPAYAENIKRMVPYPLAKVDNTSLLPDSQQKGFKLTPWNSVIFYIATNKDNDTFTFEDQSTSEFEGTVNTIHGTNNAVYIVNPDQVPHNYRLANDGSQIFRLDNHNHVVNVVSTANKSNNTDDVPVTSPTVTFKGILDLHFHSGSHVIKDIYLPYTCITRNNVPIKDVLNDTNPSAELPTDYLNRIIQRFSTKNFAYDNNAKTSEYQGVTVYPNEKGYLINTRQGNVFNNPQIRLDFSAKSVKEHLRYEYNGQNEGSDVFTGPNDEPGSVTTATAKGLSRNYHVSSNDAHNTWIYGDQRSDVVDVVPNVTPTGMNTETVNYVYYNNNRLFNEGSIVMHGINGQRGQVTGKGLHDGYRLANDNDRFVYSDGTYQADVVPMSASADVEYVYNGKTVTSTNYSGHDYRAINAGDNNVVINSDDDNGIPDGYHLVAQNNLVNYDNKPHKIVIEKNVGTAKVIYDTNNGSIIPSSDVNTGVMTGTTNSDVDPVKQVPVPQGYHVINQVSPYRFGIQHVNHDDNNPSDHIQVVGNQIAGTAVVHLVYKQSNGTLDSSKSVSIPIKGRVGDNAIIINPWDYAKDNYDNDNSSWVIPMDWHVAPNQANHNYKLSHTFSYVGKSSSDLIIQYVDADPGAVPVNHEAVDSDDEPVIGEQNLGEQGPVGTQIKLGIKGANDGDDVKDLLQIPFGWQLQHATNPVILTVTNHGNVLRLMLGRVNPAPVPLPAKHSGSSNSPVTSGRSALPSGSTASVTSGNASTSYVSRSTESVSNAASQSSLSSRSATSSSTVINNYNYYNNNENSDWLDSVINSESNKINRLENEITSLNNAYKSQRISKPSSADNKPRESVMKSAKNANQLKVNESTMHGADVMLTRIPINAHFKWFMIVKACLAHTNIWSVGSVKDFNRVLRPKHRLSFRILKAFKITFDGKNYVRYEFRFNHKNYFVTGNSKYVRNSYLQNNDLRRVRKRHKHDFIKVISPTNEYRSRRFTKKMFIKRDKAGKVLKLKRIIFTDADGRSDLLLTNNHYITANKNWIRLLK